jgi:hypothetical protein
MFLQCLPPKLSCCLGQRPNSPAVRRCYWSRMHNHHSTLLSRRRERNVRTRCPSERLPECPLQSWDLAAPTVRVGAVASPATTRPQRQRSTGPRQARAACELAQRGRADVKTAPGGQSRQVAVVFWFRLDSQRVQRVGHDSPDLVKLALRCHGIPCRYDTPICHLCKKRALVPLATATAHVGQQW